MPGRCTRGCFPAGAAGAADAGHLVAATLAAWGVATDVAGADLAVAALVSTGPHPDAVRVRVHRHPGRVRIDLAPATPAGGGAAWPRHCWALRLVDQVADEWGTRTDWHSTGIWLVRYTMSR